MKLTRRSFLAATFALFAGTRTRFASGSSRSPARYAGRVAKSGAFVAIVDEGGRLRAYVCDGKGQMDRSGSWTNTSGNLYAWFEAKARNGEFKATSEDGTVLHGRRAGGAVHGTVRTRNGKTADFKAPAVTDSAPNAGLVRVESGGKVGGWIQLPAKGRPGGVELRGHADDYYQGPLCATYEGRRYCWNFSGKFWQKRA